MSRLIVFNKPFAVLSQFTDRGSDGARETLSDYIQVPEVYPAGRLDRDSEGLLLLTDDGRLQARIAEPRHKMPKTYLVQVEGYIDDAALDRLRKGVMLKDGMTKPARAERIDHPQLWQRDPPVRFRKLVPDCFSYSDTLEMRLAASTRGSNVLASSFLSAPLVASPARSSVAKCSSSAM